MDIFEGLDVSEETKASLQERFNEETKGLQTNMRNAIDEKKTMAEKYKGIDLEAYSTEREELAGYRTKAQQMKDKELIDKGEFDKLLNEKTVGFESELKRFKTMQEEKEKEYNQKIGSMKSNIFDFKLKDQISKIALKDEHFNKSESNLQLLEMLAKNNFGSDDNGDFAFTQEKYNAKGEKHNFESWFEEDIRVNFPQLFSGVSGAGQKSSQQPQQVGKYTVEQRRNLSQAEYKQAKKDGKI